ncbi:Transposable element Tcb1 transposase [Amphibalanus amphitrite]|uniref:Transposable element Tcb1 transposase n=1 Tax=Amphibalanus amphitrite TaxID=1232801 RepID=A0A6A4WQZ6_AMPAM|nr:Transposable element Tcb1 transposase [Amphibalanus amphitrite]
MLRRRGLRERFAPRNVATRQQSGRCTVHVWGWIDGEGRGSLHRIGRGTAAAYRSLLANDFLPSYDELRPGKDHIVLQQDNAPTHTARTVQNVWGIMTQQLTPRLNGVALTEEQLWEEVQAAWQAVTPTLCRRLADSMVERLEEVVANDGNWTRY